ncbi:hypothetical protein BDF22DRAFT_745998 [Syncephalis plumigaleata]|nr:hypothetical protein BDF22DRAFT_745998 [Syncephalis plumigaleata]
MSTHEIDNNTGRSSDRPQSTSVSSSGLLTATTNQDGGISIQSSTRTASVSNQGQTTTMASAAVSIASSVMTSSSVAAASFARGPSSARLGGLFRVFRPRRTSTEETWSAATADATQELSTSELLAAESHSESDGYRLLMAFRQANSASQRARATRDIAAVIRERRVDHLEAIWAAVSELLAMNSPTDARRAAFEFMLACIHGQYTRLGLLRAEFYRTLQDYDNQEDTELRITALRALVKDGRDISGFEKSVGRMLLDWLRQLFERAQRAAAQSLDLSQLAASYNGSLSRSAGSGNGNVRLSALAGSASQRVAASSSSNPYHPQFSAVLLLLTNVVKFNASCFEERETARLIEIVCRICDKTLYPEDVQNCLGFMDVAVRYAYVPQAALTSYVRTLCRCVNLDQFARNSWAIMRNLLKSHCAHGAILILCSILEDDRHASVVPLLRGAVFFLGMSSWGSQRVETLSHTFSRALSAMKRALSYKRTNVDYEILLNMNRLLKKYGVKLTTFEWELYYDMLDYLTHYALEHAHKTSANKYTATSTSSTTNESNNTNRVPSEFVNASMVDLTDEPGDELLCMILKAFARIIARLQTDYQQRELSGPTHRFIRVLERLQPCLTEESALLLIDYYVAQDAFYPVSVDWLQTLSNAIDHFYKTDKRTKIRLRMLNTVIEVYEGTKDMYADQVVPALLLPMLADTCNETDDVIRQQALQLLLHIAMDCDPLDKSAEDASTGDNNSNNNKSGMGSSPHGRLMAQHHHHSAVLPRSSALRGASAASLTRSASSGQTMTERSSPSGGLFSSTGVTSLFVPRPIQPNCHAHCAAQMLKALRNECIHAATRCILLNCLLQLRANPADHRIYLVDHETAGVDRPEPPFATPLLPVESAGPASRSSTLSGAGSTSGGGGGGPSGSRRRLTIDTERGHQMRPTIVDHLLTSSTSSLGSNRRTSEPPPPSILLGNSNIGNNNSQSKTMHATVAEESTNESNGTVMTWTPPRLSHGLVSFLSQDATSTSSNGGGSNNSSNNNSPFTGTSKDPGPREGIHHSTISSSNELLSKERDWTLYESILSHFLTQLYSKHLFCGSTEPLEQLRSYLCQHIRSGRLGETIGNLPNTLRRADVFVYAYRLLTVLVSYRRIFTKQQQDEMVVTFYTGLQRWSQTARGCIHALTVCLYELPLSMTKMLPSIVAQLSQIMSTQSVSAHILEFLSTLTRLPHLYVNFVENDYKMVFGIALQYIKYNNATLAAGEQPKPGAGPLKGTSTAVGQHALAQYVLVLAYNVITFWFVNLRLTDRRKFVSFIVRGLLLANEQPGQSNRPFTLDEQTETCLDMLARYAYANCTPKAERSFISEALLDTKQAISRTWVMAARSSGWAQVTARRPSGVASFLVKLENRQKDEQPDLSSLPALLMAHWDPDTFAPLLDNEEQNDEDVTDATASAATASSTGTTSVDLLKLSQMARRSELLGVELGLRSRANTVSSMASITPNEDDDDDDDEDENARNRDEQDDNDDDDDMLQGLGIRGENDTTSLLGGTHSESAVIINESDNTRGRLTATNDGIETSTAMPLLASDNNSANSGDSAVRRTHQHDESTATSLSSSRKDSALSVAAQVVLNRWHKKSQLPPDGTSEEKTLSNNTAPSSRTGSITEASTLAPHPGTGLRKRSVVSAILAMQDTGPPSHPSTPMLHHTSIGQSSIYPGSTASLNRTIGSPMLGGAAAALSTTSRATRKADPYLDPAYLFIQLSSYPDLNATHMPVPLPEDDATQRAINILDRTPVVDFHKVGVVYVAPGQCTEAAILGNRVGSSRYARFLNGLGELIRLKNCKDVYTGGLDTEMDLDGAYTYYWKEATTQLIFHIPTLMPTDLERDPNSTSKKRHIGNDFVTIIYNESGLPFAFDTLPSQFNFVQIVITPLIDCDSGAQVITHALLAAFVRQIALHVNIYAQVFLQSSSSGGSIEYVANWKERLRQIKRVRDRATTNTTNTNTGSGSNTAQMTTNANTMTGNNNNNSSSSATTVSQSNSLFVPGSSGIAHSLQEHLSPLAQQQQQQQQRPRSASMESTGPHNIHLNNYSTEISGVQLEQVIDFTRFT